MPFCSKCGADVSGVASCPQCGTAAAGEPAGDPSEAPTTPQATPPQAAPAAQSLPNNVAGALAYVTPIPAIIFLLIDPFRTIRFVRFHSLQSIIFCLAAFVLQFALAIVSIVLSFVGGGLIGLMGPLVSLGVFVLWIVLVIKAYQGQEFQLPVISGLAAKWL